jgi:hypothetical protein
MKLLPVVLGTVAAGLVVVPALAQRLPPSDDPPPVTPLGDIAGLHQTWQDLNLACRRLPEGSVEGEATCLQRDVLTWQLGQLGWCLRQRGLVIEFEMCPPTKR